VMALLRKEWEDALEKNPEGKFVDNSANDFFKHADKARKKGATWL
jgi:hypothetical protein